MGRHEAAVIGAGPAGLAAAAMLNSKGIDTVVIEEADEVGASWSRHYDRLHLHTVRWLSGLPGLPIPRAYGKWVARDDVRRYLRTYAEHHRLRVDLNTRVTSLERQEDGWLLTTSDKPANVDTVVIATGYNRVPFLPGWSGLDNFAGELLHSSRYRNPRPFVGRTVLVVGTGNSGAEIAADLVEGGAGSVWLAVRTPPNIRGAHAPASGRPSRPGYGHRATAHGRRPFPARACTSASGSFPSRDRGRHHSNPRRGSDPGPEE
jgi:cation diffusion facilitator CzcD-associated flavoprotein CzcO